MMNLIQETEISKKKSRNSLAVILVTVIALLLGGGFIVVSNGGVSMGVTLLDWSTLFPMLIVTILFVLGTGLGHPFLQAFTIATGKKKVVSETERIRAKAAIKLASNTLLGMGIFQTCVGFMVILPAYKNTALFIECLTVSIPIALLGILYGLVGFLLFLPIRMKLEAIAGIIGK